MKQWITLALALATMASAALNKDGLQGISKTHSAQTMGHSKFGIGFMADVSSDISFLKDYGGYNAIQRNTLLSSVPQDSNALSNFLGASLYPFMSIGLGSYFDFGVSLPIYYEKYTATPIQGSQAIYGLAKTSYGDLRINTKFRFPIPQDEYIVDVALLAGGAIKTNKASESGMWVRELEYMSPTKEILGTKPRTTVGFGIPQNEYKVGGIITMDMRRMDSPAPLVLHANAIYRAPFADYSPVLALSAAGEIYLMDFFSIYGEIYSESASDTPVSVSKVLELSAGGVIHTDIGIELYLGLHSNLGGGEYVDMVRYLDGGAREIQFSGRTTPNFYAMTGFTWNGYLIPQDADGDEIVDKKDRCPDQPEDFDEFEDEDGCPDIDNDKDGVVDMEDKCPIDPEDKDAYVDEDGCPDPDNDGDGVLDVHDRCPLDPETVNGIEDADGCPESDKDADGIVDGRDMCIDDAEDKDSFMDGDGCPDPDNDNDAILDENDKCPNVAETKNGIDDADGCPEGDADFDGVMDEKDECPTQTEDRDGFEDKDGCPDEDNDKDGILDSLDKCPIVPQGDKGKDGCPLIDTDKDGFADDVDQCPKVPQGEFGKDGCPILDTDKDGITDDKDECPKKAEDMDDFQDNDGCPDVDNDMDGVLDTLDKCPTIPAGSNGLQGCPRMDTDGDGFFDDKDECPTQPEDLDGFEDKDGCPDLDNDKDGLADKQDKCPNDPETVNQFNDEDGCPDQKVKPIEDNVTLDGVNFKTGTADLTFESKKVLDQIVEQLKAYPEVHIEIRGHTDNVGKRASNKKLSENRAKAVVDYFASKGVDRARMAYEGFADEQPIDDNKTAAGRAKNRRIEMYRTK